MIVIIREMLSIRHNNHASPLSVGPLRKCQHILLKIRQGYFMVSLIGYSETYLNLILCFVSVFGPQK